MMKNLDEELAQTHARLKKLEALKLREKAECDFNNWRKGLSRNAVIGGKFTHSDHVLTLLRQLARKQYPASWLANSQAAAADLRTHARVCFGHEFKEYYAAFLFDCAASLWRDGKEKTFWSAITGTKYNKHNNAIQIIAQCLIDKEEYALAQLLSGTDLAKRWHMEWPENKFAYYYTVRYDDIMPQLNDPQP